MEQLPALCLFFALSVSLACAAVENVPSLNANPPLENGLSLTFYKCNCPKLESIVQKRIRFYLKKDSTQAAGWLPLHFHDCFVQGCDASVPLDGSASRPSKQEAPPNLTLRKKVFEITDDIKERVDKPCGVTVSCADITALPARDSVSGLDGTITATKNLESGKNINTGFQFAKLESFTLVSRGHIYEQGEILLADLCKKQRSVAPMERVFKGRTLLEATKPKPHPGSPAHHH